MHLAPETSAFSLAPRTHISRANVIMKHLTAQTFSSATMSATTRGSQQFACNIPLQAVYTCAAAVCVLPCSLVFSTQSGCTIWCTSTCSLTKDFLWPCCPHTRAKISALHCGCGRGRCGHLHPHNSLHRLCFQSNKTNQT